MWGAMGPFLPAAAMVVAVVTRVVLCAKATEKCNKNTKLVVCKQCLYTLLTRHCKTFYISRNTNSSVAGARVVAWPEPKTLLSNGTLAYWVSPESSCHCKND
jgi:hypothetical protein